MGKVSKLDPGKKSRRRNSAKLLLGFCALLLGAIVFSVTSLPPHAGNVFQKIATKMAGGRFGLCFTGAGINCVVDGDTFWMDGEKIRVADIDAPETHPPRCATEADLGQRATTRLRELLNEGPVELQTIDRDHDQYGRQLRIVTRNGESLGLRLVAEGLARNWTGSRQPWC